MVSLFLIPLLMLLAVMFIYRFSGKREILQMDLVQFIYAFLIYPVIYLWLKNFIYILLRNEIGISLSLGEWVTLDTAFTILFLYFYAFGIIHAITKTFSLNLNRDPLYDMFEDSKYFHEFLSHVGMYAGIAAVGLVLSIVNVLFPLLVEGPKSTFYAILAFAGVAGFLTYIGTFYFTNKGFQYSRYKRIMQLTFGLSFLIQAAFYFVIRPQFSLSYSVFWFSFTTITSTILSMFIFNPTKRFGKFLSRLPIHGID